MVYIWLFLLHNRHVLQPVACEWASKNKNQKQSTTKKTQTTDFLHLCR